MLSSSFVKYFSISHLGSFPIISGLSYYLVAPSDGEWGIKHDNGSWSGLMGLVVNEVNFLS